MLKSTIIGFKLQDELNSAIRESTIASQQDNHNNLEFEKEKLSKELEVKDRIDISRKEYEEIKSEMVQLKHYKNYIKRLSEVLKINLEVLLNSKIVKHEFTDSYTDIGICYLNIRFEIKKQL